MYFNKSNIYITADEMFFSCIFEELRGWKGETRISTSVFEASMIGLPTIFIDMHDQEFPKEINSNKVFSNDVYLKDYKYPYKDLFIKSYKDLENILVKLNDKTIYDDWCKNIYEWSRDLYSDFDIIAFEDFLLHKINTKNKYTRS